MHMDQREADPGARPGSLQNPWQGQGSELVYKSRSGPALYWIPFPTSRPELINPLERRRLMHAHWGLYHR